MIAVSRLIQVEALVEITLLEPGEDGHAPAQKELAAVATNRGRGKKLSFEVEQGKEGPVVVFSYSVGLPDDLRPHYHLYAIPRNATWRVEDKK